jgi:hypothetical protein
MILVGALAVVLLAVIAKFTVFGGDDDNDTTATTEPSGFVSTVPSGATTTTSDIPPTPNTFDQFDGKNPFEPAVQITTPTSPTTATSGTTATTGSTVPGQTTTTTLPPTNNPDSQLFTLNSIVRQGNGTYLATVTIGATVYSNILEGETFGPSNTYRFVQGSNDNCGDFQHGDVTFNICENSSTLK